MTEPQEGKPAQRRPLMEFWPRLHRKQVSIHLNGQPMISGEITAYGTYEVIVKLKNGKEVLIPKGAITSVDLPEGWRQLPNDQEEAGHE